MLGILYVCHGSRDQDAITEVRSFISSVMEEINVPLQEYCFLELTEPSIDQGIVKLLSLGVKKIAVIPVLLLNAGHYYKDIPEKIKENRERYPDIQFIYGKPLGVQDRLIDILVDRIKETGSCIYDDAKILLVGRGSTYPETQQDFNLIRTKLEQKTKLKHIDVCFLAALKPSFDQVFQDSLKENHSQIWIIPYLWFTGFLMNYLRKQVSTHSSGNKQLILTRQLGHHPIIKEALRDQVYETIYIGMRNPRNFQLGVSYDKPQNFA